MLTWLSIDDEDDLIKKNGRKLEGTKCSELFAQMKTGELMFKFTPRISVGRAVTNVVHFEALSNISPQDSEYYAINFETVILLYGNIYPELGELQFVAAE